jgi:hypothetical protein
MCVCVARTTHIDGEKVSCPCVGPLHVGLGGGESGSEEGLCICFDYLYFLGLSLILAGEESRYLTCVKSKLEIVTNIQFYRVR